MDLEFLLTLSFDVASGQPRVLQLSHQMLMFYGSVRVRVLSWTVPRVKSRALSRKRFVVGRAAREKSQQVWTGLYSSNKFIYLNFQPLEVLYRYRDLAQNYS